MKLETKCFLKSLSCIVTLYMNVQSVLLTVTNLVSTFFACGFPPQFNNLLYYSYMKWWMSALWNFTNTVLGSIESKVVSPFALSWLSQRPALAWTGTCQSCSSIWAVLEIHGFASMGVVHGFYFTIPYQKIQYQQELTYFQWHFEVIYISACFSLSLEYIFITWTVTTGTLSWGLILAINITPFSCSVCIFIVM